jgi:serine/threonine-protein kinase
MDVDQLPSREGESLKSKYQLENRLGIGGMAEVYRARNVLVDRTVAIKLLHREHAANQHIVDRFLQEARAANYVRHPNVVEVLDIDQDENGVPFIVQEYLEGEDLSTRLEKSGEKLPYVTALRVLLPVIKAIGVAHAKGLVHRDLKPENIFLAWQQGMTVPKVLDFGISKMPVAQGSSSLTITGTVLGSPAYMSPEQIQDSQSVDTRSDVWALGVILYRAISGELPYSADSPAALFVKICTVDPVPLDHRQKGLPPLLVQVIHRCLNREPAERFADADTLYEALSRVLERESTIEQVPMEPATPPATSPQSALQEAPVASSPAPASHPAAQSSFRPAARPVSQPAGAPGSDPGDFRKSDWGDPESLFASLPAPAKPKPETAPKSERPAEVKKRPDGKRRVPSGKRVGRRRGGNPSRGLELATTPAAARRSQRPYAPTGYSRFSLGERDERGFDIAAFAYVMVAALLVVGVVLAIRYLEPAAVSEILLEGPDRAVVPFGAGALLLFAGSVVVGLYGIRLSSLPLVAAVGGVLVVAAALAVAAFSFARPDSPVEALGIFMKIAPWAATLAPVGFAVFGAFRAKEEFGTGSFVGIASGSFVLLLSLAALVAGLRIGAHAVEGFEARVDALDLAPDTLQVDGAGDSPRPSSQGEWRYSDQGR